MAIAYFIPDQAKLLAGRRQNREATNNQRNSSNTQTPLAQQQSATAEPSSNPAAVNRSYGTTINVTVPTSPNASAEATGCWDFLTQVFCHALRFYHESSQIQPTVIQISVNFQNQTGENNNNSPAETPQENFSTGTENLTAAADNSTTTSTTSMPTARPYSRQENSNKPKTCGKRKN